MADSELAGNDIADPLARDFEIEVEVLGWTEPVAVPSPAQPGAVRCAVEQVLRDLGPTTIPRPSGPASP